MCVCVCVCDGFLFEFRLLLQSMAEKRASRKMGRKPKCDHCKLSVDALTCNLYDCFAGSGCSSFCCQACAFNLDQSTAGADEVPSNTDIVCSSCASTLQKANWWIMNPLKKGNAKKRKRHKKTDVPVQQPKGTGSTAKVRGGLY